MLALPLRLCFSVFNDPEQELRESLVEVRRLGVLIGDDLEKVEEIRIVIGGDYLHVETSRALAASRSNRSRAIRAVSAACRASSTDRR